MPRSQNASAKVNAAFLYKLDADNATVLEARIVYGAISSTFIHATNTEEFLKGKSLFTNDTLQRALGILKNELIPAAGAELVTNSKKKISLGLFYKVGSQIQRKYDYFILKINIVFCIILVTTNYIFLVAVPYFGFQQ